MSQEGCGNPPPMSGESKTVKVHMRCDDCGEEWDEEHTEGSGDTLCPIPGCGAVITVFKQTEKSDTVGINHYKCPKGHVCPDECCEHLTDCVLDMPYIKVPDCPCPCPSCKKCAPHPMGICQKDGKCWVKTVCFACGNEYLCEPSQGEVCPYCCSSDGLVEVLEVDANNDPVLENDCYKIYIYCRRCKNGSTGMPPSDIPECN